MTTSIRRLGATLTAALVLSLVAAALVMASPAEAQRQPHLRTVSAPNVFYPVAGRKVRDLRLFGKRPGTEIKAPCRNVVRAAHPGTALVSASPKSGPNLVTIVTTAGRLTTYYGYMSRALITSGQLVQAGQPIGRVGREGAARTCSLYFAVKGNNGEKVNPTKWLHRTVGKPVNTTSMYGNWGFVVASLNVLGASHTKSSARYPTYDVRTRGQVSLLHRYGVDVAGLQEFQRPQRTAFGAATQGVFGVYPAETDTSVGSLDRENSIIWRAATMEFLEGYTIDVPYFNGMTRPRKMPVVLLRHKASGRTAYFINVHNPASGVGYGNQTANRRLAISIERNEVVKLRATGRPVFLMGDFNDRTAAFCPLTAGKLMITPDSLPSMTCAPPRQVHIDWLFAAGPARFTRYARDWKPKDLRLTDHPIVWARTHLAE